MRGVLVDGTRLGAFGFITPKLQAAHDLEIPLLAAELNLDALVALYPPRALTHALPAFPAIERDLSFVVSEETPWASPSSGRIAANRPVPGRKVSP